MFLSFNRISQRHCSEAGKRRLMPQHASTKRLVLSHGSCTPQLPCLEGCLVARALAVLHRSALGSRGGGCSIN